MRLTSPYFVLRNQNFGNGCTINNYVSRSGHPMDVSDEKENHAFALTTSCNIMFKKPCRMKCNLATRTTTERYERKNCCHVSRNSGSYASLNGMDCVVNGV